MKILKSLTLALIIGILAFSILIDICFGIYTNWTFLVIMTGGVTLLVLWLSSNLENNVKLPIILGSLILMLSIRYWDYDSKKPFMRSIEKLEKGMTKEEVIEKLNKYKLTKQGTGFVTLYEKETEPLLNDKINYLIFKHSEELGNCDELHVYFVDNVLYKTVFSHD